MRHVRLTVTTVGPEREVPAMYWVLSGAPYLDRVVGRHWNVSGDRLGLLVDATGDADAFRDELRAIPEVLDFEIVSAGDDWFYAYLRSELNELSRRLFETFTRGSLLVVPPLEYGGDGSATLSVFGPIAGLYGALSAVEREWLFLAGCDMSRLSPAAVAWLAERLKPAASPPDALVPVRPDGSPEPLHAFYRREAVAAARSRIRPDA